MSILIEEFLELLRIPGVSGFEDRVRNYIIAKLREIGLKPRVDPMGNVIAEIGEGQDQLLFTAHMDEVGLLVTYVEQDGKLRFRKIGGIDDRVLPSQRVLIYTDDVEIEGVIGLTPPHLQLKRDVQVVPWHDLYIDIGVESRDEVYQLGIRPPCPAVLEKRALVLARGRTVCGRGIDDRAGCLVLLKLAERLVREPPRDRKVVLAWTVQEEVGLRGAKALTQLYRPRAAIVLDTVSCCNPVLTGDMRLGGGPVLRILDAEFIASPILTRLVQDIARKNSIPVQVMSAGGTTDALEIQEVNTHVLPIGIATKYSHSSVEMCSVEDLKLWLELVHRVAIELDLSRLET